MSEDEEQQSPPSARPRLVLLGLGLLLLGACQPGNQAQPRPAGPPNILLISIDTLRADHLSSYGYRRPTSPFIDELASRGIRFTHAFVNTHGTPPSHTTLFTSLSQESHGVSMVVPGGEVPRNDVAPDELVTLAELLSDAGYRTLAVTGGGFMGKKFGLHQGFERFLDRSKGIENQAEVLLEELSRPDPAGRPIFAFLHTYEVHSPYESPSAYSSLFGSYDSDFEPTNQNLIPIQGNATKVLSDEDLASIEAAYDRGIRYTDDSLRRTIGRLRASGFLDHAILILTSDHGEELGEHGGVLHPVSLFDELLHVPLILLGPEIDAGVSDPRMVSTLDIAPTLLALAGVVVPDFMQGRNLTDPAFVWSESDAVFSQYGGLLYSMRTPRWKLIQRVTGRTRLYDLPRDPRERRDVASEYPEVVGAMEARLRQWREKQPSLDGMEREQVDLTREEEDRLRALGYL